MKKLIFAGVLFFAFGALADHHKSGKNKQENFETRKTKAVAEVEKRISHLNELKACLGGASAKEQLKECREKHREFRKEMMQERKKVRGERKERRQMKKKERMKKRRDHQEDEG